MKTPIRHSTFGIPGGACPPGSGLLRSQFTGFPAGVAAMGARSQKRSTKTARALHLMEGRALRVPLCGQIGATGVKIEKETQPSIFLVEQHLDFSLEVGNAFSNMGRGSIMMEGPISILTNEMVRQYLTV